MGFTRRILPLVLLAGCAAPPADPPDRVPALIEALSDDDAGVRDRATAALRLLLPGAAPALACHVEDGDAEVAARCRALLYVAPDDWTWYQTSGLTGVDLQIVDYVGFLTHWCGNAKWEARMMLPKLRSLQLHPAACLPLMRAKDAACPEHGLPLFRITADEACFDRVAAELDLAAQIREGSVIALLRVVARRTGTDFTLSNEGDLRFRPGKALFECRWGKDHHDHFRPDQAGTYAGRSADLAQAAWEEARQTAVKAWALPR